MKQTSYQKQLQSPHWQRKRLEVMELHEFRCQECYSEEKQLHIHHPYYLKNTPPWDYDLSHFRCLCDECHEKHHHVDGKIKSLVLTLCIDDKEKVLNYASRLNPAPIIPLNGEKVTPREFFDNIIRMLEDRKDDE